MGCRKSTLHSCCNSKNIFSQLSSKWVWFDSKISSHSSSCFETLICWSLLLDRMSNCSRSQYSKFSFRFCLCKFDVIIPLLNLFKMKEFQFKECLFSLLCKYYLLDRHLYSTLHKLSRIFIQFWLFHKSHRFKQGISSHSQNQIQYPPA